MLLNLKVINFALIEDLEIEFKEGLTVLTGETGTGKSIILEALHLIFAKRSDQEMIRHGSSKALVSATFKLDKNKQAILELDEVITITREIDISGRHKITLNDKTITLNLLKIITEEIGMIHSQEDSLQILDHNEYLNFINLMDRKKTNTYLNNYLLKRSNYLEALKHLNNLITKKDQDIEQKEYMIYQLNEIKSLNLFHNEKIELEDKVSKLINFDKISNSLKEVDFLLESEVNISSLYTVMKLLEKIKVYDESYLEAYNRLNNVYYELVDVKSLTNSKLLELDFNESEFNFMQERIYEISKLEEKYEKDANELLKLGLELEEKIALIDNYDDYIKGYQDKVSKFYEEAYLEGLKLSELRKKLALEFENLIMLELKDLDLNSTNFKVKFNTLDKDSKSLYETGIDEVEFLISLNEGEPIRTLSKVASGGERARFVFAIKSIYAKQNNLDILILDEIDIGISGKTAAMVARKMSTLSENIQLIVISHLPQVAARADNHYGINKKLINNRMVTDIKLLDYDDRIKMIALMLSDESLSEFAIEQAKMLLKK